eukprot:633372-Rhodomonas_salina.1
MVAQPGALTLPLHPRRQVMDSVGDGRAWGAGVSFSLDPTPWMVRSASPIVALLRPAPFLSACLSLAFLLFFFFFSWSLLLFAVCCAVVLLSGSFLPPPSLNSPSYLRHGTLAAARAFNRTQRWRTGGCLWPTRSWRWCRRRSRWV